MNLNNSKIAIVGLGYVGLPLALAFAKKYKVVGFDINSKRIEELIMGNDSTLEIQSELLLSAFDDNRTDSKGLKVTSKTNFLEDCNIFIITVPTPIDKFNRPVLKPMIDATKLVANFLKPGNIVIYESTVYPGVTEDEMVPELEKISGLEYNKDFYCGYSPERINPGDKEHTITKILKVTSGSTDHVAEIVDNLYNSVIKAGSYRATSIKVAEAAKVIENCQRDLNIAFVNELSKIFNLIGVDTHDVLDAAGTKWNFLNFKPGLVGGHCIGVDPYYLAQKAEELGYHPEIILSGRRLNDSMGKHVATEVIKLMMRKDIKVINSKVLLLGFTFKEDCPDIRNTRVIDIYNELNSFDMNVDVYDPWINNLDIISEYEINILTEQPNMEQYSAIILAVPHQKFSNINIKSSKDTIVYDVKGILPRENIDGRL